MVVGMPQHQAPWPVRVALARQLRRLSISQNVVAIDSLVAAIQDVAAPLAYKHTFSGTGLIAGAGINRPRALRRPPHNLDVAVAGIIHQRTIALKSGGRGLDDWHRHAGQPSGQPWIEVVNGFDSLHVSSPWSSPTTLFLLAHPTNTEPRGL